MSTFKCEVVRVTVQPHSNADKLELIKVRGWQCVSQKGLYKTGDLAIYLPVDSVLPKDLVEKLGITNYYSRKLKTIKLRGEYSQGMVAPTSLISTMLLDEGDDVTAALGVTKYDPPIPVEMAGIQRKDDPRFVKYTGIENAKNYPGVFKDGEFVIVTEKIHGTNFRAANIEGEIHVGSHNCNLLEPKPLTIFEKIRKHFGFQVRKVNDTNLYWRAARILDVASKLKPGEQIFGEVYGAGVQDLTYGKKPGEITIGIFDVFKDGKYLNYPDFIQFLLKKGWESYNAPILFQGEFHSGIPAMARGMSTIDPTQIREGIVIRPATETLDPELKGRKILKYISEEYLTRKDATERH